MSSKEGRKETEYITEEDVRNLIKSENISHQLTGNGFSLAIGFDESDLPSEKARSMIGDEDIIDVMDRVLVEVMKNGEKLPVLKKFLLGRITEIQKRLETWSNHSMAGQSAYSVVSARFETYKEILSMISDEVQP